MRTPTATLGKRLVIGVGWALLLGYLGVNALSRIPRDDTGDFGHFYHAARAMNEGQDIYAAWQQGYIYPPLLAFLYEPFALLSEPAAALCVLFVNLLLLTASALLAARELARRWGGPTGFAVAGFALVAVLLTEDKLRGEIQMWQTNCLMLFLLTAALCLLDRWPTLAGGALGMAFSIKYLPLVALPYLLLRRRFVAAGSFVVSAVGFAFLPAIRTGWQTNLDYLTIAYRGLFRMLGIHTTGEAANIWSIDNGLSVSITSALARALPSGAAMAVAGVVALGVLFWASRQYRRSNLAFWYRPDGQANRWNDPTVRAIVGLEWVGLWVAALAFSPQTNTRHLSMLLLANTTAVVLLFGRRWSTQVPRWPLVLATVLLAVALIFPPGGQRVPWLHGPWHQMGGPTWAALGMYVILLWFGLRQVAASTPGEPQNLPPPGEFLFLKMGLISEVRQSRQTLAATDPLCEHERIAHRLG
jgi:hypothetical protein